MGKSGKKIKSDRINTLRKQYDAFLEDDKKRRDRNEYILGRLEEMRSSAALVKVNYKANVQVKGDCFSGRGFHDYLNDPPRMEESVRKFQSKNNIPSDCLTKQFESSILKEISKNYILIPKLQSSLPSGLTFHKPPLAENDDADWTSKYNILNELKKREKESIPDKVNDFILEENHKSPFPSEEPETKQNNEINMDKTITDNLNALKYDLDQFQTNSNKIEKGLTGSNPADYKSHVKHDDTISLIEIPKKHISHNLESYKNDQFESTTDNIIQNIEVSQQQFMEPNSNTNNEICNSVDNHNIAQETTTIHMNQTENQCEGKGDDDFDNESFKKNKSKHLNQVTKEEISYPEQVDQQNLKENDDMNASYGFQEKPQSYIDNEPEFNVQKLDSNEASHLNANEELEKEQDEMFYQNSDKTHEYDENNIDIAGNPVDNENYTNEQYPYYDESQHEQPYTTEINEHEESTERYDPNYEQQYTENYENVPQYDDRQYDVDNAYETQQNPVESNVNYEEVQPSNDIFEPVQTEHNMDTAYQNQEATEYNLESENYEAQHYETNIQQEYSSTVPNDQDQYAINQEYNQVNTEPETVQEMEQVLDREDGYIDNQNTPLNDTIQEPISTNVSSIKNESSVKVS